MSRGYNFLPRGRPQSPPRRDMADLPGSSRTASKRSQMAMKQDLNIDDFGDMGSDEDDFQTLAADFVLPKPPVQPQYNLVPYGLLRDDDELVEEDYDGVPISESSTSSPKPESPVPSPWKSSPHREEMRGDPISVLGSGNRPNPAIPKWTNDGRSQDKALPNRYQGLGSSVGALGGNKMGSMGTPNPQTGKGRWDSKISQSTAIQPGNRSNTPSFMAMNKPQTISDNAPNFVRPKDDRDSFLHTSFGRSSIGSSTKNFVPAKPIGNTFPQLNDGQGTSKSRLPGSNLPSSQSYDIPSSSWNEGITKTVKGIKEQVPSVPNQNPSQIEMLQAAALQQALTGITQLDPQTGLSLLMQAGQNPTLAAALLNTISSAGLAGSRMTSSSNPAIEALLKSAGNTPTPVAAAPLTQPNLGAPIKMPMPDGSGATRYPAPDLSSLVFDPSTGFRFDDSTGLHYDANSGYFFNNKLKIYLRWDKFTQTYLRVENPPGLPRFINTPTMDPPGYQRGPSSATQGVLEPSRSLQNRQLSRETIQSPKAFPPGNFNQDVGAFKSVLEQMNTVQPNIAPSYTYSGGSHSSVDTRSGEANPPTAVEQKLASLPNLAETSLFNKLRKAKLAAQPKPDRKRWGEPDPLLEAVQKHTNKISQSQTNVLNLEEILQRSRQFMKGGDMLTSSNGGKDRLTRTNRSPGRSGDERRTRSRSRSPGRQRRRSQSLEKRRNPRMRTSRSPQSRKRLSRGRSPDSRGRPHSKGRSPANPDRTRRSSSPQLRERPSPPRGRHPNHRLHERQMSPEAHKRRSDSRGRSPNVRARRKKSLSPEAWQKKSASGGRSPSYRRRGRPVSPVARKRRSVSRGRSPGAQPLRRQSLSPLARRRKSSSRGRSPSNRGRGGPSLPPEARKRGRSPIQTGRKSTKSPDSKYRRTSKVGNSDKELPVRLSKSPEHRRHLSQTPDRTSLNRSPPPMVKVVLNRSPGGSKIGLRDDKRAANLLTADKRIVLRKLSSSDVGSADKALGTSPNLKSSKGENVIKKSLNKRFGGTYTNDARNSGLDQEKESVKELKPIPYNSPQAAGKKSKTNKNKDVSGYKSLSNLRNQAKDKLETDKKPDTKARPAMGESTERQSPKANLTTEEDDERQSRNHRLVSERTFSNSWKVKKPEPTCQVLSSTKLKVANQESNLPAKNSIDAVGKKDNAEDPDTSDELEESNDFDFLNDALDDDNESTVIDEYEEILDYQDLDSNSESKVKDSTSTETDLKPHELGAKKSPSKESIESAGTELNLDHSEQSVDQVSLQCSSVDGSELTDVPTINIGDQPTISLDQSNVEDSETLVDKKIEHNVEGKLECDDAKVVKSSNDDLDKAAQPTGCSKDKGSVNMNELSENLDAEPATTENKGVNQDTIIDKNRKSEMKSADQGAKGSSVNKTSDNEEWNVVDSVDDGEEAIPASDLAADEKSLVKLEGSPSKEKPNNQTMHEPMTSSEKKGTDDKTATSNSGQCGGTGLLTGKGTINHPLVRQVEEKSFPGNTDKFDSKLSEPTINSEPTASTNDEKVQSSADIKPSKQDIHQNAEGEPLLQVRSVSDIETFLLLSSQEVEAKREQGHDSNTSKLEKKGDIFSRLGEKLTVLDGSGSAAVSELHQETPIKPEKLSNLPSTSAQPGKIEKLKPTASVATKKAKPKDPCKSLFVDEPTPTVLLGPMNFIEPLPNFQHFTQKYMQTALIQENVRFKKIYVHHEDGTGAPYHYILITFPFAHVAADWVRKNKGIYKGDLKIFKRTAGHTKHKFIPDSFAYLHFTEPNWICAVCKKSNFPPRSLCFGCFQNKDPRGLSPLILLDKGRPPFKSSTWVGTPKLKFFATKEKVMESVPPLDGFDILRIEMVMDEEMGLPAGICVFELPSIIEAGKMKKYLNRRDVECVAVEMNEQFLESLESDSPVALAKETPPNESQEDPSVSGDDLVRPHSENREGRRRPRDVPEMGTRSPRFLSREVRVTKVTPSSSRDRLPSRNESRSPGRSIGYRSPLRHVSQIGEDRYPSPETRSVRSGISKDRSVRAISPNPDIEPAPYRPTKRFHRSPVRSPAYVSPRRYQSRSPIRDSQIPHSPPPRSRSPLPRRRSPSLRRRPLSPRLRSPSPRRRPPSPRLCSPSPRRRPPSPRLRSLSPRHRSPPPKRRAFSPRRRSPSPRRDLPSPRHGSPSALRPTKPDGRSEWSYPPPDPKNFRFEPRSGLDYDPTTTLYYEPTSCCFYNDDTNEWLEYEPRSGCYRIVS